MNTLIIAIIPAVISAVISVISLFVAQRQARREVELKIGRIREEVTEELIRQRIGPYSEFMKQLEMMSSPHLAKLQIEPNKMQDFMRILQEAIYGKVGLLASHDTRELLVYLRSECQKFSQNPIDLKELRSILWALHFSLRSDIGIRQPEWDTEVERVHTEASSKSLLSSDYQVRSLVKPYTYWRRVDELIQDEPKKEEQ